MRDKFKGYYKPKEDEENAAWQNALIVMDTNVVLDLYKYHANTTDEYLTALAKFSPQLWLPYQIALEFHRNRPTVRAASTKAHKDRIASLKSIQTTIQNSEHKSRLESSAIEKDLVARAGEAIKAREDQLKRIIAETHVNSVDTLLERITSLFEGRVGDAPTAEQKTALEKVGSSRFDAEIPPGYEDRKKKPPGQEYGDYILWQQIIDHAKAMKKDVIVTTEDKKDDWWLKINSDTVVGPRPELIQEFRQETGQEIFFYSGPDFFGQLTKRANTIKNLKDLDAALADVLAVSEDRRNSEAMEEEQQTESAVSRQREFELRNFLRGRPPISVVGSDDSSDDEGDQFSRLSYDRDLMVTQLRFHEEKIKDLEDDLHNLLTGEFSSDRYDQLKMKQGVIKYERDQISKLEKMLELNHNRRRKLRSEFSTVTQSIRERRLRMSEASDEP